MIRLWYRTVRTYALWLIVSPFFLALCSILALFPASRRYDSRVYFTLTSWWSRCLLFATFAPIRYRGKEFLPVHASKPVIFVMNHSSALDIPLAEVVIGSQPHVWLSKKEYGSIPLFGWLLTRMHVLVDRSSRSAACVSLRRILTLTFGKPRHVLIFTEGTRSHDGALLPFMPGFAFLAKKLQRPVVPLMLHGAHRVMPKNGWLIHPVVQPVEVHVGQQMTIEPTESIDDFVLRVQQWFATQKGA